MAKVKKIYRKLMGDELHAEIMTHIQTAQKKALAVLEDDIARAVANAKEVFKKTISETLDPRCRVCGSRNVRSQAEVDGERLYVCSKSCGDAYNRAVMGF